LGAKFATQGKIFSQIAAGKPIVAITPKENDIVQLINNAHCGWLVETGDSNNLANLLIELETNPDLVKEYGNNARSYFLSNHSIDKCVSQFDRIFNQITNRIR
jgi:glycosyltransferase involved in cell wall biosynthesis